MLWVGDPTSLLILMKQLESLDNGNFKDTTEKN